jgi:AcrR family transcriptional regulator
MTTKRERTRERLLDAALALFAEQGYDATTVTQIAQRAGVTEMTFFRTFGSKEGVLLEDPYDPLIAAAVAEQPATLPVFARVLRGVRAAWASVPPPGTTEVRERVRIVAASPSLRAAMARNSANTARAMADALPDAPIVQARVAAAATVAALDAALLEWSLGDDDDLGSAIEAALDVLECARD